MEIFKSRLSIYKLEKYIIIGWIVILLTYMHSSSGISLKELVDFSGEFYWFKISAFLIMSLVTLLPYAILLFMSERLHRKKSSLSIYHQSLIITILIVLISLVLYLFSWKEVRESTSSTASVIFAVLPIYISIGIMFFYGLFMLVAWKNPND